MQMCYIQTLGLNLDVFGKDYMQFQTAFPSYLGRQSMTKKYVNTMSSISRIVWCILTLFILFRHALEISSVLNIVAWA